MTLEKKLQTLRKKQSLSQEELASMVMVSRQAVSKWESGENIPDIENLLRLSKLYHVSIDYLLNDEAESEQEAPAIISAVKKEMKKRVVILLLVLLLSVITALCLANKYHITGLITGYLILIAFISLFLLVIILIHKVIRFLERK